MKPVSIEPSTTALVLIDLQYGIVGMNIFPNNSGEVVSRASRLAQAFRSVNAPVILVNVANMPDGLDALLPITDSSPPPVTARPANWETVVEELGAENTDIRITKRQWGAFYGTELDLQLRRRGIKTLVLAGISTNVGVESTARDAFERGYHQIFVEDAMGSPSEEAHLNSLSSTFPRLGRIRSTEDVIDALGSP